MDKRDETEMTMNFNIGLLYQRVSQLRQGCDVEWIIELLPKRQFGTVADICCGGGQLMAALIKGGYVRSRAIGIDRSSSMLDAARMLLSAYDQPKIELITADLLQTPEVPVQFNLMTMTSALHWFYPTEEKILQWIRKHLVPDGYFCLTTYHPLDYDQGYAGTDHLVRVALEKMHFTDVLSADWIPMGTRTRRRKKILAFLKSDFFVEAINTKYAIMKVTNADQYIEYHRATFGDYYLRLLPPHLWSTLLQTLGEIAQERMEVEGCVTQMEVTACLCRPK
jgi:SAM-dependent methyltransferase